MKAHVDPYTLEEIAKKIDAGEIEGATADMYNLLQKDAYSEDEDLQEVYSMLENFEDKTAPQQKSAAEESKAKLDEMIEWRRLEESGGTKLPVEDFRGKREKVNL